MNKLTNKSPYNYIFLIDDGRLVSFTELVWDYKVKLYLTFIIAIIYTS